jgi:hypothetical protein
MADHRGSVLRAYFYSNLGGTLIPSKASPAYLGELIKTPWFWGLLQNATRGVGARRERTRPEQFLSLELPMPTLKNQVKGIDVAARNQKRSGPQSSQFLAQINCN